MNTKHFSTIFIMILIACITGISADIYAPSLNSIAQALNSNTEQMQRSMSIFMLGVSISQLFYGPLSDGIGRKKPLILGLIIFLLGSVICLIANNIYVLLLARLIQGCGAGACASLWRSIFRDSFNTQEISKYGSYVGIIMTFMVACSPTIGGYLNSFFGYKSIFLFLACYCLINILLVSFAMPETSTNHNIQNLSINFIISALKQLLSSKIFIGYTLCVFLTYGAFFSWFVSAPILLIDTLKVDPINFAWINLILGAIFMSAGAIVNGKLVSKKGGTYMLRLGWTCMIIASLLMLFLWHVVSTSLIAIILPMSIFLFGVTLIWPNSFALAFAPFGNIAGCTGALYSFMQLSGGALISWLISFLPNKNPNYLALTFMITAILALIIFEKLANIKKDNLY